MSPIARRLLLGLGICKISVLTGIRINALINDTTGCLLACAYKRPDCAISCILGTGTNASYVEDMDLCEMYEGARPQR